MMQRGEGMKPCTDHRQCRWAGPRAVFRRKSNAHGIADMGAVPIICRRYAVAMTVPGSSLKAWGYSCAPGLRQNRFWKDTNGTVKALYCAEESCIRIRIQLYKSFNLPQLLVVQDLLTPTALMARWFCQQQVCREPARTRTVKAGFSG
jgi:hypothetical protein